MHPACQTPASVEKKSQHNESEGLIAASNSDGEWSGFPLWVKNLTLMGLIFNPSGPAACC
jgi:hypothetical protein